jgi:Methane oxygenase PmoA
VTSLRVGDVEVARYVTDPDLDIRLAPRPYLHPVRTLAGTVVTDELCHDHPWHLGASVTLADVNGVNLWGGRTYVRDEGYVWRDDHGRIRHAGWLPAHAGFAERLDWCDGEGNELAVERRAVRALPATRGWQLSFSYALTAPDTVPLVIGSPATNGRTGGAGYGGFFWRLPPGDATAFAYSGDDPHGSTEPWTAVTVGTAYTLVFRGLAGDDRWFVRTGDYNGVCAALAFEKPVVIPRAGTLTRHLRVLVADGRLSRTQIHTVLNGD